MGAQWFDLALLTLAVVLVMGGVALGLREHTIWGLALVLAGIILAAVGSGAAPLH